MPKRKPNFSKRKFSTSHSGVSLSEAFPSNFPPEPTMYNINVSRQMLLFCQKMANDPVFRNKVTKLL